MDFKLNKFKTISLLILIITILSQPALAIDFVKLAGSISDRDSDITISDALVEIIGTSYNTRTDSKGYFQIIFESNNNLKFRITKDGYEKYEKQLNSKSSNLNNLDIRLMKTQIPTIKILSVLKNQFITGEVGRINPNDYDEYKVLIYVRTDRWYIHPLATPVEGKGFAKIQQNGKWKIKTIWREHIAYEVAALLVRKEYMPYTPLSRIEFDSIPYVAIDKKAGEGKL